MSKLTVCTLILFSLAVSGCSITQNIKDNVGLSAGISWKF